jgi:hypothetical protein
MPKMVSWLKRVILLDLEWIADSIKAKFVITSEYSSSDNGEKPYIFL